MTGSRPAITRSMAAAALLLSALAACGSAPPADRRVLDGDPERGRQLIADVGCGACHVIPGVGGANGIVGPSLAGVGQRKLLAGALPNRPDLMARWVREAPALRPETGMPRMPLSPAEARHVAAYLYTLR